MKQISLLAAGTLLAVAACLTVQAAKPKEVAAFFEAVKKGDEATVKAMAAKDKSLLNAHDPKAWQEHSPLAAGWRNESMFTLLLSLGSDPTVRNSRGEPAFFSGKFDTKLERLPLLLKAGADVNMRDKYGMTLLFTTSTDARQRKVSEYLLDNGADIKATSNLGTTLLHVATDPVIIDRLTKAGASLEAVDARGRTPVFSNPGLVNKGARIDTADNKGWTPLHEAAWLSNSHAVALLIEKGAPLNAVDDEGWTPLRAAEHQGDEKVIALLKAAAEKNAAAGTIKLERPAPPAPKPEDKTVAGELRPERPTLVCLGYQWDIKGDANRNATLAVAYRKKGAADWIETIPGLRIGGETTGIGYTTPHMFAGSILDLAMATEYEVKLTMADPDGVDGDAERTLTMRTRGEAKAMEGGPLLHVYAKDFAGRKLEPSFPDVQSAYAKAEPGTIILVHAGNHQQDLTLNKKATAAKPIVIRGAGDGEAKLQGQGNNIVNVAGSAYHIFEDLTLYDAGAALVARGETHALTVRRCKFHDVNRAVFGISNRNTDFTVTDCVMRGPAKDWHPRISGKSQGFYISGQGHVAAFNSIRGYWDGLSITGNTSPDPKLQNCAIDFYNNDLSEFRDDAIEMDYGVHNIRVFRNHIRNTFMGISTQPVQGGPGYVFRNVVYATTNGALKLNQMPAGLIIAHNTLIGNTAGYSAGLSNCHIFNNLCLGRGGEWVLNGGTGDARTEIDYNAYRFFPHPKDPKIQWRIHWSRVEPMAKPSGRGIGAETLIKDLAQFSACTWNQFARHGMVVDYDEFANCPEPNPAENQHDYSPIDLTLTANAKSINKGKVLRFFSDGYADEAPDLGAYERGAEIPHYGPRN